VDRSIAAPKGVVSDTRIVQRDTLPLLLESDLPYSTLTVWGEVDPKIETSVNMLLSKLIKDGRHD